MKIYNLLSDRAKLKAHTLRVILLALPLIALAIFFFDQPLSQFFARPEYIQFWLANREVTNIALSEHYFVLAVAIFITSTLAIQTKNMHDELKRRWIWARHFSINAFWSLVASGLLLHVMKIAVGRQRPHKTPDFQNMIFSPFNLHWDNQSMPSGHAQVSFTVAALILLFWPKGYKVVLPIAFIIAFTRVVTHAHFLSDVLTGAILGYLTTLWTVHLFRKTRWGIQHPPAKNH